MSHASGTGVGSGPPSSASMHPDVVAKLELHPDVVAKLEQLSLIERQLEARFNSELQRMQQQLGIATPTRMYVAEQAPLPKGLVKSMSMPVFLGKTPHDRIRDHVSGKEWMVPKWVDYRRELIAYLKANDCDVRSPQNQAASVSAVMVTCRGEARFTAERVQSEIERNKGAKCTFDELMDSMATLYVSESDREVARRALQSFHYKKGTNIVDHCIQFEYLCSVANSVGALVDDHMLCSWFKDSLPADCLNLVHMRELTERRKLSLSEVVRTVKHMNNVYADLGTHSGAAATAAGGASNGTGAVANPSTATPMDIDAMAAEIRYLRARVAAAGRWRDEGGGEDRRESSGSEHRAQDDWNRAPRASTMQELSKDQAWPEGLWFPDPYLQLCRKQGRCYICFDEGHRWYKCPDLDKHST